MTALSAEPERGLRGAGFVVTAIATPNDPLYGQLWGMAKINAPAAWDVSTGSAGVVVGDIDTGIDYNHPDLAANIWVNPGEIAGNGLDDDGNGYIDDIQRLGLGQRTTTTRWTTTVTARIRAARSARAGTTASA